MLATLCFAAAIADPSTYLRTTKDEMQKAWPANRTVNIVCHGHSVPAGYAKTPIVDTFNAYPHLLHQEIKANYPMAVINVIVTAIGGENSVQGAKRFDASVLTIKPDVVTIDYGLNDRFVPLEATKRAWVEMITKCKSKGICVLLLTPSPDLSANIGDDRDPLAIQADQIREIAHEQGVGLVDTYRRFKEISAREGNLQPYMAQSNHPNRLGHQEICKLLVPWFITART